MAGQEAASNCRAEAENPREKQIWKMLQLLRAEIQIWFAMMPLWPHGWYGSSLRHVLLGYWDKISIPSGSVAETPQRRVSLGDPLASPGCRNKSQFPNQDEQSLSSAGSLQCPLLTHLTFVSVARGWCSSVVSRTMMDGCAVERHKLITNTHNKI